MLRCLPLLYLCLLGAACAPKYSGKVPPKVINGEIDLTGWDFKKDGPVKLDGEWLFTWEKFVEPSSWEEIKVNLDQKVSLPAEWKKLKNLNKPEENLPGIGFASYAMKVQGLSEPAFDLLTPKLREAGTKFLLNLSGDILHVSDEGVPAIRAADEKPLLDHDLAFSFRTHLSKENNNNKHSVVILIHHSNHHLISGIIGAPIIDGYSKQVKIQNSAQNQKAIMVGVSLIIGIYHLLIFILRPVERGILFFGLLCVFVSLRQYLSGVAQGSSLGSSIFEYELSRQLAYFCLVLIPLFALYYLKGLMPSSRFYNKISGLALFPASLLIGFVFFADPILLTPYNDYYLLFIFCCNSAMFIRLIIGVIKKEKEAHWILLSYLIVFAGVIHDLLSAKSLINTSYIGPYALGSFILMQAVIIARRSSVAFETATRLSKEMSTEVKAQTSKINYVQSISQEIQNTSNLQKMQNNLKQALNEKFGIDGFIFFVLEPKNKDFIAYGYESISEIPEKLMDQVFSTPLSGNSPKSLHGAVLRHRKTLYLTRMRQNLGDKVEKEFEKLLSISALMMIPLLMDNKVYAILTLIDHKYKSDQRIKRLTKRERIDLELLSQYVSSALYQALQKEQIEKAKHEAEQAQAVASRARSEAAVNQLAAHLAHEVNNPLNYISMGKTIQNESFARYHEMILSVLSGDNEETKEFKAELDKLQKTFEHGMRQANEGQARIAKVIAEIRAITGVDGLNFKNFDIVPIINEEMVYSLHRNQVKIGEQAVKVTGTEYPIEIMSNQHILARSIRTVISNCIHFAKEHQGNDGELYINCGVRDKILYIDIGNNSFSIKTVELNDLFDLEKSQAYGTEQIGLAMIKELLHKINSDIVLADHGRESGKVVFQLQVPLES